MPNFLIALIYVLALSSLAFALATSTLVSIIGRPRLLTWISIWTIITISAFLLRDFWLLLVFSSIVLLVTSNREPDRLVQYVLTFCMAPAVLFTVPGFGGILNFAVLSFQDFLAILLLMPILLLSRNEQSQFGKFPKTFLLIYFGLTVLLTLRDTTFTNMLRSAFSSTLMILVPFFAFSTAVNTPTRMRMVVLAMIFSALPLALVGVFELLKHWHVYGPAFESWTQVFYAERTGLLRASGPLLDSIPFGFLFMVSVGFCLGIPKELLSTNSLTLLITLLMAGLISSLSRGPLLGTLVVVAVFLLTGQKPITSFLKFIAIIATCTILLYALPIGSKIFDLLPYVGSEANTETSEYRVKLLENAWKVIERNPIFGSIDFLQTQEMQEMMTGQGIIDVTNTYLVVALRFGLVGLCIFLLFFMSVLFSLARAFNSLPQTDVELKLVSRSLFATLCGVLVTIMTVSSVGTISHMYWILSGLCVAQTRIIRSHLSTSRTSKKSEQRSTKKISAKSFYRASNWQDFEHSQARKQASL